MDDLLYLVFVVVGAIWLIVGWSIFTNRRGATDWWVQLSRWGEDTFGRGFQRASTREHAVRAGLGASVVGAIFLVVGLVQLVR